MNELLHITIDQQGRQVVSACTLYEFLGFEKSQWARWSKKNIENNPFALQNHDWTGFDIMSSGNSTRDYALTVEFAERVSMLARTPKGEQIRRWFQQIKNQALAKPTATTPADMFLQQAHINVEFEQRLSVVERTLAELPQINPVIPPVRSLPGPDLPLSQPDLAAQIGLHKSGSW